ncbi:hypothetical protein AB0C02_18810 [Micromonospora sp. NPDC048999]|uniref:hypothetical protein n=1 Tax=Micromonospora sp. NPDC048999 TaxID=3155391 RepID=UPI003409970B
MDGDDWPLDDPGQGNGLVHPCGHGASVYTGIHTGPVDVRAVSREQAPDRIDDSRPWQEIAEVSFTAPTGHLRIRSFEDVVPLPALGAAGPGTYRVRVYAEGRDTDIDGTVRTPVEHYRIEVWPAPPADEVIHRRTDRYGESVRSIATPATDVRRGGTQREPDGETFEEWVELDD